ncbi:calcium influx-promoting protein ehs1 [Plectosphaerella plurivora]|uniref:Calcium influx-promoting protein ehs1 n=1 Tax=Plectosphaerella plurivora TaxID=936078 RepID=A0A9P8VDK9_9PEZI|nr:calcium influx-promoting protein ehs1 [Plectosphaerella plurivora]
MQLSPLQSRLAASVVASACVLFLYFFLLLPSLAQATEVNEASRPILEEYDLAPAVVERSSPNPMYQPDFSPFDRSLLGRAPPGMVGLLDNVRTNRNAVPGIVESFVFEASQIWPQRNDGTTSVRSTEPTGSPVSAPGGNAVEGVLQTRQGPGRSKVIYISATTCLQPQRLPNNTSNDPPQLTLFVSTSPDNVFPGPDRDMSKQQFKAFDEGAVTFKVNATGDVYFGISATTTNQEWFQGSWNFDVAVSTEKPYHTYDESPSAVLWMDSDSSAALLQTPDLANTTDESQIQQIMSKGPPYVMFVDNQKSWATRGVRHSMCGLQNYAQMKAISGGHFGDQATTLMTTRGPSGFPKQQFHFNGLNASSSYWGILAQMDTPSLKRQAFENRPGGGGQVFQAVQFETKTGDNCKIITDLSFCNETEYAVPANDNKKNITELASFYDDFARDMYANFEKNLAQVACDANSEQSYSLVRNCTTCARSYKKWLCSVTIPRCEDFSSDNNYTLIRNVAQPFPNGTFLPEIERNLFGNSTHNQSRIARIDEEIAPGPYREVLPCEDLCYDLVRDCPASLQFACPQRNQQQFAASYQRLISGPVLTCNYPGAAQNQSDAAGLIRSWALLGVVLSMSSVLVSM